MWAISHTQGPCTMFLGYTCGEIEDLEEELGPDPEGWLDSLRDDHSKLWLSLSPKQR